MTQEQGESVQNESTPRSWPRILRYVVALGLLGVALLGTAKDWWEVCTDQLAAVGSDAVVEVCGPPALSSLPIVVGAVLLALLLWPEISELSIGGLTLKRALRRHEEETEKKFESLRQQMSVSQHLYFDMRPEAQMDVDQISKVAKQSDTAAKQSDIAATDSQLSEEGVSEDGSPVGGSSEAIFLGQWAETEAILDWLEDAQRLERLYSQANVIRIPPDPDPKPILGVVVPREWLSFVIGAVGDVVRNYWAEIEAAGSARNILVHGADSIEASVLDGLSGKLRDMSVRVRARVSDVISRSVE